MYGVERTVESGDYEVRNLRKRSSVANVEWNETRNNSPGNNRIPSVYNVYKLHVMQLEVPDNHLKPSMGHKL
jgi:hypothetical protein